MNYTENYQLSQWMESDRVLMEDFNADNRKIDNALASFPVVRIKSDTLTYYTNQYNFSLQNIAWENYVELILLVQLTTNSATTSDLILRLDGAAGSSDYYDTSMSYGQNFLLSTPVWAGITSMVIRIPYTYVGFPVACISQCGSGGMKPAFHQAYYGNTQKLRNSFQTINFICNGGISSGSRFTLLGLKI